MTVRVLHANTLVMFSRDDEEKPSPFGIVSTYVCGHYLHVSGLHHISIGVASYSDKTGRLLSSFSRYLGGKEYGSAQIAHTLAAEAALQARRTGGDCCSLIVPSKTVELALSKGRQPKEWGDLAQRVRYLCNQKHILVFSRKPTGCKEMQFAKQLAESASKEIGCGTCI